MAKFYGSIGFSETVETAPDVWEEQIVERKYSGDVIRNYTRWQNAQQVNDNLSLNNKISIIADAYAISNLGHIRYAVWHGCKWKVTGAEVQHPRLVLDIGEVFNGGDSSNE